MGAPTENYVSYADGNDYPGTTFTDGVYTDLTKNLAKTGAFTNSKAGHRIYLTGTGIVSGFYTIASVTDADNVVLATDAGSDSTDVACTQHDGSTSLPWNTIQGCLDLCGRDSTNGDRINVKAGTAVVNYTSLNLTTYGTPTEDAPLIMCGYTTTAGDGGMGEIDCNGAALFSVTTNPYTNLMYLEMHNFGNNDGVKVSASSSSVIHCKVHKGASSPSGKQLIGSAAVVAYNYVHDGGTSAYGIYGSVLVIGNYVYNCPLYGIFNCASVINNIVVDCPATGIGSVAGSIIGNTVYSSTAATGDGILAAATFYGIIITNNIVVGYSGVGGAGLESSASTGIVFLANNAYYGNTAAENLGETFYNAGGKVDLAADPFVNAAGGDFSLKTSVVGAIDGAYPGAWYGPAATTDHADIGAVQMPLGAINIFGGSIIR